MSAHAPRAASPVVRDDTPVDPDRVHRLLVQTSYLLAALAVLSLVAYGHDYYLASASARALSSKHAWLRPSGTIGLWLGKLGFVLCLLVALYPLRKRWSWLGRIGASRRWLNYHALLGILAPVVITLHSSFKFSGVAGVAYWLMLIVAGSGIVGRYLYAQIPASLTVAELTLREREEESARLHSELGRLGGLPEAEVQAALHAPDVHRAGETSLVAALGQMLVFDLLFPFRVWRLRRRLLRGADSGSWRELSARDRVAAVNRAIALARSQAQLKKRVAFLSQSRNLMHLWHVVHRPFSASFALFGIVHVVLMLMLGFY